MTKKAEIAEQVALRTFEKIARRYPDFSITKGEIEPGEPDWIIPVQQGIAHEIHLGLSNIDELHFGVGRFWSSYFPCAELRVVKTYFDAVTGFIDGKYRVREHYRGQSCIGADLQRPAQAGWSTLYAWSKLHWPFPRKKTYKVVTNT